mmetsp:Transcript_13527/g.29051  ORF Transcript_13527/g.29051 Transcript_13527/m.29051 type:complete len:210 (-) Transcript_13527:1191-1820(-)
MRDLVLNGVGIFSKLVTRLDMDAIVPMTTPTCSVKRHTRSTACAVFNEDSLIKTLATPGTTIFINPLITTIYTTRHAVTTAWSTNPNALTPWPIDCFIMFPAFSSFDSPSNRAVRDSNSSLVLSSSSSSDSIWLAMAEDSSSKAILSSRAALAYSSAAFSSSRVASASSLSLATAFSSLSSCASPASNPAASPSASSTADFPFSSLASP